MDYGIKISRTDINTFNSTKVLGTSTTSSKGNAHILLTLAIPYLNGAYDQLERYELAALRLG